jgi:hypothetical protein
MCDGGDRPLTFPFSAWPGFGFGESHGFYLRGTIVANLVSVLICTILAFTFGIVMSVCFGQGKSLQSSDGELSLPQRAIALGLMPSSIAVATAVVLDGCIFASTSLIVRISASPSVPVDVVLALLGFFSPIVFLYVFVLKGLREAVGIDGDQGGLRFGPSYVTTHVDICLTRFARGAVGKFCLFGSSGWFAKGDVGGFGHGAKSRANPKIKMYAMMLRSIRASTTQEEQSFYPPLRSVQYYFFWDAAWTILTALVRGSLAGKNCEVVLWITAVIMLFIFVNSLVVGANIVPLKGLISRIVNLLAFIGALALAIHYSFDQYSKSGRVVAELCALFASGICFLLPVMFLLRRMVLCCIGGELTPANSTFMNENAQQEADSEFATQMIGGGSAAGFGAGYLEEHELHERKNPQQQQQEQIYTPSVVEPKQEQSITDYSKIRPEEVDDFL